MEKLKKEQWTKENYSDFLEILQQNADSKYSDFTKKLTPTKYEMLGIRVPIQRKIAHKINQGNPKSFLEVVGNQYYEEVMIEGLIIAEIKEETLFQKKLNDFLPKIDNWAICDGFCNSIKIVKNEEQKYFPFFRNLLKREEPFTIRVGLITLLSFYVKKEYLNPIFEGIDEIQSDHYYVNMGAAWLLAEMYIKFPKETEVYFKQAKINDFTMNKTISKIRDSYRISKEQKDEILKYKRSKRK